MRRVVRSPRRSGLTRVLTGMGAAVQTEVNGGLPLDLSPLMSRELQISGAGAQPSRLSARSKRRISMLASARYSSVSSSAVGTFPSAP